MPRVPAGDGARSGRQGAARNHNVSGRPPRAQPRECLLAYFSVEGRIGGQFCCGGRYRHGIPGQFEKVMQGPLGRVGARTAG